MGKVYMVGHIYLERTMAIKILSPDLSSDYKALERFRQEARAATSIQHDNIVRVFDFGVTKDSNTAYIAMEYLRGISLREAINYRWQFDCERVYFILRQICSALEAAKRLGMIHRDLKPDNIWLEHPDRSIPHVKVLDFGLAKLKEADEKTALTEEGTILGTPAYISPEQWRGEELDFSSDIYSLGVILYELLTGQVPFNASNPMEIGFKHIYEQPKPLSNMLISLELGIPCQLISPGIAKVVLRALGKTKNDRQESALQLAQEYETALVSSGLYIPRYWEEKNKGSGWPFNPIGTAEREERK